jgi:hypothetical protein
MGARLRVQSPPLERREPAQQSQANVSRPTLVQGNTLNAILLKKVESHECTSVSACHHFSGSICRGLK